MFNRNQDRFMNNGGIAQLGNRQQGYGLQQLNQPQIGGGSSNTKQVQQYPMQPQPQMQQYQQYQNEASPGMYQNNITQQPMMNTNPARDRYINDDMRRRLQQMMMRRRMMGRGRFGMDRLR